MKEIWVIHYDHDGLGLKYAFASREKLLQFLEKHNWNIETDKIVSLTLIEENDNLPDELGIYESD